jgi:ATPase subunit of ABC transporter with duplicated ATPase domains
VPPKRHILKDVSLSFFPGAKIGVLGTNGSGKSTLLKIMAGVVRDIEGEAVPMPGIKIGYLPQEPQLDADKTVIEEVESALGDIVSAKQRLDEIAVEGLGYYAAVSQPEARKPRSNTPFVGPENGLTIVPSYLNNRAASIYGGSNEIQRDIMAKLVLKL